MREERPSVPGRAEPALERAAPAPARALRSALRRLAARSEAILWIVGSLALGAAGLGYADGALFQLRNANMDFTQVGNTDFTKGELSSGSAPADTLLADRSLPAAGTPIARIAVPRLELDAVVAEGETSAILRRAVGRLSASALPGEPDNIVLAAHRDTYFRPLEGIALGDLVTLESAAGLHSYVVEWMAVVEPDDVAVTGATGYPALTLITCYPFRYIGDAPQRFVVRARRLDESAVSADALAPLPAPRAGATGG